MSYREVRVEELSRDDKILLGYAKVEALRSDCARRQVGVAAMLEMDYWVGYNGSGCDHGDSCAHKGLGDGSELPCQGVHAEITVLEDMEYEEAPTEGMTMAVTLCPCIACAKALVEAKVAKVLFLESYGQNLGAKVLDAAGIEVIKVLVV